MIEGGPVPKFPIPKLPVQDDDNNRLILMIIIIMVGAIVGFIVYFKYFAHPPSYDAVSKEHCDGLKDTYNTLGLDPATICKAGKCAKGREPISVPIPGAPGSNEDGTCHEGYKISDQGGLKCCLIDSALTAKDKKRLEDVAMAHMKHDILAISGVVTLHLIMKKALKRLGKAALKKYVLDDGAKKIAYKGLVRMGEKTGAKVGAMLGTEALEMGACLAIPPPIGELAAGAEFLGFIGDIIDIGGFNQYLDNKDDLLTMRDQLEGRLIDLYSTFPAFPKPPFCFNLANILYLADFKNDADRTAAAALTVSAGDDKDQLAAAVTTNDSMKVITNKALKDIYDVYQEAMSAHQQQAMITMLSGLTPDDAGEFLVDALQGKDLPQRFTDILSGLSNKVPLDRDQEIWNYMKSAAVKDGRGTDKGTVDLGISRLDGTYVMFRKEISSKKKSGITLNQAGVNLYNSELDLIPPDIGTGPRSYLVYSKFFRDAYKPAESVTDSDGTVGKKYFLKQHALPIEFATVNFSYGVIKGLCTSGLCTGTADECGSTPSLSSKYPIQKVLDLPSFMVPADEQPKQHGVSYDHDTGLCKYNNVNSSFWSDHGWCMHMDRETMPKYETMECGQADGGCNGAKYPVCHKNEAEEMLEWVFPATIIGEGRRVLGYVDDFIDHNPVTHFLAHTLWNPSEWF